MAVPVLGLPRGVLARLLQSSRLAGALAGQLQSFEAGGHLVDVGDVTELAPDLTLPEDKTPGSAPAEPLSRDSASCRKRFRGVTAGAEWRRVCGKTADK